MPNGKSQYAQAVYLAQLQACKGSCKCKSCELLRKAADAMTEETLNPTPGNPGGLEDAMTMLQEAGYDVTMPVRGGEQP
uniref:Uncharacterized protein n=1 Tax=viral metagenome TaxID=1070528 RepID=A0A6H1ZR50_9ZZZZ